MTWGTDGPEQAERHEKIFIYTLVAIISIICYHCIK